MAHVITRQIIAALRSAQNGVLLPRDVAVNLARLGFLSGGRISAEGERLLFSAENPYLFGEHYYIGPNGRMA